MLRRRRGPSAARRAQAFETKLTGSIVGIARYADDGDIKARGRFGSGPILRDGDRPGAQVAEIEVKLGCAIGGVQWRANTRTGNRKKGCSSLRPISQREDHSITAYKTRGAECAPRALDLLRQLIIR